MLRLIAAAALCLTLTGTAWAQSGLPPVSLEDMLEATPARDDAVVRRELAERYIALTEGEGIAEVMASMTEDLMAMTPDMPEDQRAWFRRTLPAEMTAFADRLMEQMIPLYAEAMTIDELNALIAFHETPLGRSIARKQIELGARMGVMMEFAQIEFQLQLMQKYCAAFDCTGRSPDTLQPT